MDSQYYVLQIDFMHFKSNKNVFTTVSMGTQLQRGKC